MTFRMADCRVALRPTVLCRTPNVKYVEDVGQNLVERKGHSDQIRLRGRIQR